jgi:hypothetical protein
MAYVGTALLNAMKTTDMEERIAALERGRRDEPTRVVTARAVLARFQAASMSAFALLPPCLNPR